MIYSKERLWLGISHEYIYAFPGYLQTRQMTQHSHLHLEPDRFPVVTDTHPARFDALLQRCLLSIFPSSPVSILSFLPLHPRPLSFFLRPQPRAVISHVRSFLAVYAENTRSTEMSDE